MRVPALVSYRGRALLCALFLVFGIASADEGEAYFGDWSNDHGDILQITEGTIQWNSDKPLPYRDITEDSDGSFYLLQITGPDESNSFNGQFLRISFGTDADQFTMTTYRTQADALNQRNPSGRSEWVALDDDED